MSNQKTPAIAQPFGQLASEIRIKADHKGLVIVEAWNYPAAQGAIIRPGTPAKVAMDSRQMVLALQKVALDYCNALFALVPDSKAGAEAKPNGQEGSSHNDT